MKHEGVKAGSFGDGSEIVIGACIEVHRHLGPGLLESAYEQCLCHELSVIGVAYERQKILPLCYKGVALHPGYRLDLVVRAQLLVEIKAVERLFAGARGPGDHLFEAQWAAGRAPGQLSYTGHQAGSAPLHEQPKSSRLPAFM